MDKRSSTRAMVESALLSAIAVILVIVSINLPIFYFVGLFMGMLPITLIYLRSGVKFALMSSFVVAAVSAITIDPLGGISLAVIFSMIGLVMGYCIKKQKGSTTTILYMSIVIFIALIIGIKLTSLLIGQDSIEQMMKVMESNFKFVRETYVKMGIPKQSLEIIDNFIKSIPMMKVIIPTALIFSAVFQAFISYIISRKILQKFGYNLDKVKTLSQWYVSAQLAMPIMIIYIISIILYMYKPETKAYIINAQYMFMMIFFINGIAALDSFLKKKEVAKGLRILIIFFCINPGLERILFFIGLFDYLFNYRGLDKTRRPLLKK